MQIDARRRTAIMHAQFRAAVKEPNEYLRFYMTEEDTSKWYVLISGLDGNEGEYTGGEYIVRVILPEDFPHNPPHFYFMTEQGLYGCEVKVCISIGEFHKSDYRAVLGVSGFCNQLVSGMVGWREIGGGISIIKTSVEKKKSLAARSRAYNRKHHKEILDKINAAYEGYSAKWDLAKIPEPMKIKLGLIKAAPAVEPAEPTEPGDGDRPSDQSQM